MVSEKAKGRKKAKALIVYYSMTGNTEKVAKAIAKGLKKKADVAVKKAAQFSPAETGRYDVVGFGSGVYGMRFSDKITAKMEKIPESTKKFFLFSTSGMGISAFGRPKRILESKGLQFIGGFKCKGFEKLGPLKLIGGINKGRPNKEDLRRAEDFGSKLI